MRRVLLNTKSDFSLLWGVRSPGEVAARAAELGYDAIALADHDNLYGLPTFLAKAKLHRIRPIVAAEVTDPTTGRSALLYPMTKTGYGHLCRILTERQGATDVVSDASSRTGGQTTRGNRHEQLAGKTLITRNTADAFNLERALARYADGLAVVTDSLPILRRLADHDHAYVCIGHRITRPPPEVRHLPAAIVPPAIFFDDDDVELHRLMRAIELKRRLGAVPPDAPADERSVFEPWDRIVTRYAALPQAIEGTERLIDALRFDNDLTDILFPDFSTPPGMSVIDLLRCKTYEGARRRYGQADRVGVSTHGSAGASPSQQIPASGSAGASPCRRSPSETAPTRSKQSLSETAPTWSKRSLSETEPTRSKQSPSETAPTWSKRSLSETAPTRSKQSLSETAPTWPRSLPTAVVDRIEHELDLIESKGFAAYFLVVDEIVRQSPRICGRGSAAASIVAYCLGITNVDPIRHNLFFERFLNPGRTDPPDIDVDFAWDERDDILAWVLNRYGPEHSAMVANHLHFRPRMALRETARVFGLPEREISAITKRLPWCWQTDDDSELETVIRTAPRLGTVSLDPPWPDIIRLAARLVGKPRGLSVHPGGVVLTPRPIWQRAPIQPSAKGVNIVHWDKDGVEDLGLVKIDLLGNRSLAVIRDAIANLRDEGVDFDESTWDAISDAKTQRMLATGRTMGVFYCESPAMRQLQLKTGRGDFEHVVINTSIIRPAANTYTKQYVERVHGVPYEPIHPLLGDILAETYGIMVYQEDVSRVAMAMAGFSCEDADRLRKIMSKKDRELELAHFYKQFVEGARARGVSDEAVDEVFKMILAFSGYSFCKPHSASYTMVTYQSAYLKAHHPAAFMAAVLGNHGGYYSTQAYVSEARRLGIEVLRPDVNLSEAKFVARGGRIVTGLAEIKGLSIETQQRVLAERRRGGPFAGLGDLLARTGIGTADAKRLILAGALDAAEPEKNRPTLLWELATTHRGVSRDGCEARQDGTNRRRPGGARMDAPTQSIQGELVFEAPATSAPPVPTVPTPELRDYDRQRLLELEYERLGFLATAHPLEVFAMSSDADASAKRPTGPPWVKADRLDQHIGKTVRILSWPISAKSITTVRGEHMEFVSFEDERALYEAVLFPRPYRRYANLLFCDFPVVVTGEVDEDFGAISVIVKHIARA